MSNNIRENISSILECTLDQVTLKAKTAEKMTAFGRGEGLMAQAVVLLVKN